MRLTTSFFLLSAFYFCPFLSAQENPHPDDFLFEHSENCIACHSNIKSDAGIDVSIGYTWRATMMANSARDPYWHAGVRREVIDHPQAQAEIEDTCSTCHMPIARYQAHQNGNMGKVFDNLQGISADTHLAMDGVSCTVCHQISNENFGEESSFDGGFIVDNTSALSRTGSNSRKIFGPFEIDAGKQRIMQSAARFSPEQGTHIQKSELCATCHTLYTQALDANGNAAGVLPEQMPYQEWLLSDFRNSNSCQSCHMPVLDELSPITSVLGDSRESFSQHTFVGGNAFMLGILAENREALGIIATKEELESSVRLTKNYLGSQTARIAIENTASRTSV